MNIRLFFFLFILFFFKGFSQDFPPKVIAIDSVEIYKSKFYPTDSILEKNPVSDNVVNPRNFRENFQSNYKGPDFDYTTIKPQESIWQKLKKKLSKILQSIFGEVDPLKRNNYAENILRFFAILIIGFVLYFVLKFLMSKEGNYFFSKKNKKFNIADQDLEENIHEINFAETIAHLERNSDYRSAVRYHFLSVLKKLSDKKLIAWNPEKTNKDYLSELSKTPFKYDFKELIYIFDHIWYGEIEVDKNNYDNYRKKFTQFEM